MNIPVALNIRGRTQLQEGLCRASSSIRYEYFIFLSKTFDPLWCLNIFQVNLEDKLVLLPQLSNLKDGSATLANLEDGSATLANLEDRAVQGLACLAHLVHL